MRAVRQISIEPDGVGPNDPVRLDVAARIAFKDGSMTVSGLRREVRRGRLSVERIAGRDYTTLADIERMRVLCREEQKGRAYTSVNAPDAPRFGLSSTEKTNSGRAAVLMIAEELKNSCKRTSPASTARRGTAVIPLK